MLDINEIRNRKDELQKACDLKYKKINIQEVINLDDKRKELQHTIDTLKHQQKQAAKEKDIQTAKALKTQIKQLEESYNQTKTELKKRLLQMPNFIDPEVPVGKDESENIIIKQVGEIPKFDFEVKDHQTLGEDLGMLDKEKAAEVTGARFFYMKGDLARLQYAVINYTFDVLTNQEKLQNIIDKNGLKVNAKPFTIVIPPLMIHYDTADKMGRLHPMDDRYCLDQDQFMLIGSAEHSLGPLHMNDTIKEEDTPLRYVACTPAFRREAGSYGRDTRGILRTHQFDKIEMESFTTGEQGRDEQDFIVAIQSYLVESLGIAYQIIGICTGDMGAIDYRQMDINSYMPGQKTYRETHTSDYMTDYQARRLNIKIEKKDGEKETAHMNDATAFALGRILIAIMENYQQEDGSIKVPDVLVPYMGGQTLIKK